MTDNNHPAYSPTAYLDGYDDALAGKARAYDEGPYADGYAHALSQRKDQQCRLPAGPGEDDDCEACQ